MTEFIRKLILLLGAAVSAPFLAYGVVGLMRRYDVDNLFAELLRLRIPSGLAPSLAYLAVGGLLVFAFKVLSERLR
ncbi:hypothetical protein [Desulfohalovibrio reitneri]|uniref:hypothetical protein n=1 Tax=Desulfohalovibrio reitneri TaxID=1307759 RepID=UPI0004A719F3|nr:hypothetical protein [Desulfohalovibrio reitneri]